MLDPLAAVSWVIDATDNDTDLADRLPAVMAEVFAAVPIPNGPTLAAVAFTAQVVGIATTTDAAHDACYAAMAALESSPGTETGFGQVGHADITQYPTRTTRATTAQDLQAFVGQVHMTLRRSPNG